MEDRDLKILRSILEGGNESDEPLDPELLRRLVEGVKRAQARQGTVPHGEEEAARRPAQGRTGQEDGPPAHEPRLDDDRCEDPDTDAGRLEEAAGFNEAAPTGRVSSGGGGSGAVGGGGPPADPVVAFAAAYDAYAAKVAEVDARRVAEQVPSPPSGAPACEHPAAQHLVCALYLYPHYRVDSRGPLGCILEALEAIAPDIAAEVREKGADETYKRRWSEK